MLLLGTSCSKKSTVSGRFADLPGDSLLVEIMDFDNMREPLSSMVIPAPDGKFAFNVEDTVARGVLIYTPEDKNHGREYGLVSLFLIPGERAVLSGSLKTPVYDGTKFFKDQGAYHKLCAENEARMRELAEEYRASVGDEAKQDSIMTLFNESSANIATISKNFVKDHPKSHFCATLFSNLIGEDGKDALEALEYLSDDVKQGPLKSFVDRYQASAERASARAKASEKVKDGMTAPDFTLKNEKGEDFILSSLYGKGKYIILDFWGDWCYWCKKGIPDMKQLYKDAKGKIEILSIDCRDTEEVWKESIKTNQLGWLHVYNPGDDKNDVSTTYAIQGYPTKVILNPDGTINKTFVGEDPEFYTYVKSLI